MTRIELENGKYTVCHDNGRNFHALRNGETWRSLTGDGLVLAMAYEIERLRGIVDEVHSWAVCGAIADAADMAQNLPHICEITGPVEV